MSSGPSGDLYDRFLARRGHEIPQTWGFSYNKKQCPECGGLHDPTATRCTSCGWRAPTID